MKKLLIASIALIMGAAPIAASADPFDRGGHDGRYEGRGDHRDGDRGGAVAAGLFGLFLGAALADSHPAYAYDGDDGYYAPYRTHCDWETRAYPGPYGSVTYQQVQVCR